MPFKEASRVVVQKALDESLEDDDFYCRKSHSQLDAMGLEAGAASSMLAEHKSSVKYGYDISPATLSHLLELAKTKDKGVPLKRLIESPFFFVKACWLYEHAPYFLFYDEGQSEERDSLIMEFARRYESHFLEHRANTDTWSKIKDPKRVRVTTFWESNIFDPVLLIERAKDENIEGIELSIDFHPFNYTTLLPEELSKEKREEIRKACLRSGVKIDVHTPIVGPYTPLPDPARGKQRFFDPSQSLEVMFETVELAKDVGAGSVVVHLIGGAKLEALVKLIEKAAGSDVRVTLENYPRRNTRQTSEMFMACVREIYDALPKEVRKRNFGITLDVGHLNIEGEDPLVASERIGKWCLENDLYFRLHTTDNYGDLLFSPPDHSADVHGNVSGRGINNAAIIKLLRSMGHHFDAVAEQIQPLSSEDIATIHGAQSCPIDEPFEAFVEKGKEKLTSRQSDPFTEPHVIEERAYQFLAGMDGVQALREYLVYRKIQEQKHLSVDEAKQISQDFMKLPENVKSDLTSYIDGLLLPIQSETGVIQKSGLDLICQNISGAVFATINHERLNQIFSQDSVYQEGDTICKQGKPGREMYLVKEGSVTVWIDESLVASLGPGEIFGEISLFYNVNRSATIRAKEKATKVGVLGRKTLETMFAGNAPYARDLIYRLFKILPGRLRNLNDKYKAAIPALHLIYDGDERDTLNLDDLQIGGKPEQSDLFPTLSEDDVRKISSEIQDFAPDQPIFSEGDPGDGAYFILDGNVKVVSTSAEFKEVILGQLGEGEIFGEMSLIDEKPRSASIVTLTPCKLAYVGKEAFNKFLESRSELAFRLMGFICLSLFRHILRLDRLYSDVKKKVQGVANN
ncbi:MAG: cyclic nucleotide-binding domain-containing protein [Deltaproteobacteria bacterium]|nr:cyclic nucleotide-binding domain-containing protein [Deltaproteobacteria bacterium]